MNDAANKTAVGTLQTRRGTRVSEATKQLGTCPACFSTFQVVNGKMNRHGWTESGGRQVGVYGRAWHTGVCFGVGWAPFEVSSEGTSAFVFEVLFPRGVLVQNELAHLATRPSLIKSYCRAMQHTQLGGPYEAAWEVRIQPGDARVSNMDNSSKRQIPSYEEELADRVAAAGGRWAHVSDIALSRLHAVANWKPAELRAVTPKSVKPVHLQNGVRHMRARCGKAALSLHGRRLAETTTDPALVTCPDCKAAQSAEASK